MDVQNGTPPPPTAPGLPIGAISTDIANAFNAFCAANPGSDKCSTVSSVNAADPATLTAGVFNPAPLPDQGPTPEPGTLLLLGSGIAGVIARIRQRQPR